MRKLPPVKFKIQYPGKILAEYVSIRRSLYNELVLLLITNMPISARRRLQHALIHMGYEHSNELIARQIISKINLKSRRKTNETSNSSTITHNVA
jgi:hypothetical protein